MAFGRFGGLACMVAALTCAIQCGDSNFSASANSTGGDLPSAGSGAGEAGSGGSGSAGAGGKSSGAGGRNGTSGAAGKGAAHGGVSGEGGAEAGGGGTDGGGREEGGAGGEGSCLDGGSCPRGSYCTEQGDCRTCGDITTLAALSKAKFGEPEPLSVLNQAAGDYMLRTPRAFGSGDALLYVRDFFGGEIWLTGNAEREAGAPLPRPISEPDFLEGSPLWVAPIEGLSEPFNFIFNRAADMQSAHELQRAILETNGTASALTALPAPFNPGEPLTESVYAMAVSRERAWWMVNRDLQLALQFVTAPLDGSGPPAVVTLRDANDCGVVEFDLGTWVTPDGKLLLVNAQERTEDCLSVTGEPHDILVFELDESGHALGPGLPFPGVSRPGVNEIDASLSADLCTLYFVTSVE
ncbi:MAG TPA: hypothetical protein VGK73_33585, partial [Polyangiaceae bacterium]